MKKSLLLPLALLCTLPAVAIPAMPQKMTPHMVTRSAKAAPIRKAAKAVNPLLAPSRAEASLDESFESDSRQFPESWTLKLTNENDWMIYAPGMLGIPAPDGYYSAMATCLASNDGTPQLHEESWLISPEFTVNTNEELMFQLYFDVRSLYVWTTSGNDKNIDEEDGLILNRVNAENMKICVSVDGGDWVVLKDLWEEYGKLGYWDIVYDYEYPEFRKFSFPLSEYEGKTVKIGFCHSYLNALGGHGMFLDAVKVSLPPIEANYSLPFGTLFWGMSDDLQAMPSWALVPYYTDLYWFNETYADADFKWEYTALNTDETFTSAGNDLLTNYTPDYTYDPEARYTMFSFPTLSASTASGSEGSYTYGDEYGYVFAGISAELPLREGGMLQFGLSTFDQADDVQIYNADFDTPAWGHNAMTTDWWTNHYFEGDQKDGDYAKITSNINFFYDNGAPIVINGVRVAAMSVFDDDAEFVMDLVALNEDFTMGETIASATTKGKDVLKIDDSYANFPHSVMIGFTFDKPVVVEGVNFIARISGFNSEKVTYYAPLQSYESAALCYGFSTLEICAPSMMGDATPIESMLPTAVFDDRYNSFAIYLDAYYPYLKCTESEFDFADGVTEKTFVFDSSYPAVELNVAGKDGKLPDWLSVEKNGSFGETKITLKAEGSAKPETAVLEVSAPGVSHTLTVKQPSQTGVNGVMTAEVAETQLYDLQGRRISNEPVAGAYIVRKLHADGSVSVERMIK